MAAADREWIAENGHDDRRGLLESEVTTVIRVVSRLGGLRLLPPTFDPATEGHRTVHFQAQQLDAPHEELAVHVTFYDLGITNFRFDGPAVERAFEAIERSQGLEYLGAYATDGIGVEPGVLVQGRQGSAVLFVVGGFREKKGRIEYDGEVLVEHADGGLVSRGPVAREARPDIQNVGWQMHTFPAGEYVVRLRLRDAHARTSIEASHRVRIVEATD